MNQKAQMNKLVLALSGGADSTVLLHMAADRGYKHIHTVTFDYGQRHNREIDCVKTQIRAIQKKYPGCIITNKLLDALDSILAIPLFAINLK